MKISFVVPVFNERESLALLVEGIMEHAGPDDCRIVLVDDGSTDGSTDVMAELAGRLDTVEVVGLGRRAGKSAALAAGFAVAEGEVVFTMDGDLQDDPREIPRFLEKLEEGFDLVCGWKRVRHDPWHKTVPSRVYNGFVAWLFGLPLHDVNCGFKAMRGEVAKGIALYGDLHRLVPVLAAWMGYATAEIAVEHHARRFGRSKYGLERFARGASDVMALWYLMRHGGSAWRLYAKRGGLALAAGVLCLASRGLRPSPLVSEYGAVLAAGLGLGGMALIGFGLLVELTLRRLGPEARALYGGPRGGRMQV